MCALAFGRAGDQACCANISRVRRVARSGKSDATYALLRMLADGRFCPGRELAMAAGGSRRALVHQVREIEALGLKIHSVPGQGYRLSEPIDLLRRDELLERLSRLPWRFHLELLEACESTNSRLLSRTLEGAPTASVVACESQTAGRGRRGNEWLAPIGGSLAFSLLWRFQQGAAALSGLSLAVAVGAARALEALGVAGVAVKWPNDLLLNGRKLGGILIEMSAGVSGPSAAVIGVGLNVKLPASFMQRLPAATDLRDYPPISRTVLLAALLQGIASVLQVFSDAGFVVFRDEWQARHAWQGCRVALHLSDTRVAEGEALGVADDGALLLRSETGVQRFHSGELSLRPA
jgi:BirA family transcriptional regulator, biotin operon repressor / biotin---[acetyl-CoA-carboxylase] ligase